MTHVFCTNSSFGNSISSLCYTNNLFYALDYGNNIYSIATNGTATILATITDTLTDLVYVSGFLYVTGQHVYKVDVSNGTVTTFVTLPENVKGITYYNNHFYVVGSSIYSVSTDGSYTVFIDSTNLQSPSFITTDTSGNVYVTDTNVLQFDSDGVLQSTFITGTFQNIVLYNSNFYISSTNEIYKYDLYGNLVSSSAGSGGIAFDNYGYFYFGNPGTPATINVIPTTQGNFTFPTSGVSTTNYTNDTNFNFPGGTPYFGPYIDWTQVVDNFTSVPTTPSTTITYTSSWTLSGTGGSGKILSIKFSNGPGGGHHVVVVLQAGGGTLNAGVQPYPGPYIFMKPVSCFLEGTRILCSVENKETYVPIEEMKPGMLVKTYLHGYKEVHTIKSAQLYNSEHCNNLYKCSKIKYAELNDDLYITGHHSILVPSLTNTQRDIIKQQLGDIFITGDQYRLIACADERAESLKTEGFYTVWHFSLVHTILDVNFGIYANGLLVESCSIKTLNRL